MLGQVPGSRRITVGGDKNYDTKDFVTSCRSMTITPHVARRETSIVDGRTTRHAGYQVSQRIRKRVEEIFGWKRQWPGAANSDTEVWNATGSGGNSRQPPTICYG